MKIVLDASVVAKFFTLERGSEKARDILERFLKGEVDIVVGELTFFEVLNALRWKSGFPPDDLAKAGIALLSYGFSVVPFDEQILEKTIALSLHYEVTVYDAYYIALASLCACRLITADEKLYKKAKEAGCIDLLEEIDGS